MIFIHLIFVRMVILLNFVITKISIKIFLIDIKNYLHEVIEYKLIKIKKIESSTEIIVYK